MKNILIILTGTVISLASCTTTSTKSVGNQSMALARDGKGGLYRLYFSPHKDITLAHRGVEYCTFSNSKLNCEDLKIIIDLVKPEEPD